MVSSLMKSLRSYLVVLAAYMRVNWRSALEYRTNFLFDLMLSLLEVGMFLFYWFLFLEISDGVPGVSFEQLAALVVFNHIIYAGADTLMGDNVWYARDMIVKGSLDTFLVQPKSAVFQLFFSGAQPLRAIQLVVGTVLYFVFVPLTPAHVGTFLFGLVVGVAIFTSWVIAIHSITFRLGNSSVVYKLLSTILHFAKKPVQIFSLAIRLVLYTLIPAAYLGAVQAEQAFSFNIPVAIGLVALSILSPIGAALLFKRGLRRYESGNLIGVRV
jgi:ABC-2 type transport system permease protein